MSEKVNTCFECGEEPQIYQHNVMQYKTWEVRCLCGVAGPTMDTKGDAVSFWNKMCEKISRVDRLLSIARELVGAGNAMLIMMDRGACPRKLDAALAWRENDEKARAMMVDALKTAREEGIYE
jgi:hypothetical protein